MCLAIVTTELTDFSQLATSIKNAWDDNPHGAGFAFTNKGNTIILKGYTDCDALITALKSKMKRNKGQFLIHLRYASAGDMSLENCHPFKSGEYAVIHNGTMSKYVVKDSPDSDTKNFCSTIESLPNGWSDSRGYRKLVEEQIGTSKVALLGNGKVTLLNEKAWIYDEGTYYSNDYYKESVKRFTNTLLPTVGWKVQCSGCYNLVPYSSVDRWGYCEKCNEEFLKEIY